VKDTQEAATERERGQPAKARASRRSSFARLWRVSTGTVALVHRAAPREMYGILALQVMGSVATLGQVVLVRELLRSLFNADAPGAARLGAGALQLLLLMLATSLVGIAGSVQSSQQLLVAELVERETLTRILQVTTRVQLSAFDDPTFHDRLQRARQGALSRPYQLTSGLVQLLGSLITMAGIAVALVTIQPLLLLLMLVVYVPLLFAASQAGRMFYGFNLRFTQRDRERRYLFGLLSSRSAAAETRAYGVGGFLRRRHDDLYDERIQALRGLVRHRTLYHAGAAMGGAVLVLLALLALGLMTRLHLVELAGAGAAAAAIILLGQRLRELALGLSLLYEGSLFLQDFTSFALLTKTEAPLESGDRDLKTPPISSIEVRDVHFRYRGATRPALDGVSLRVEKGEVVALVGANGSGKTTLAKVLCGLYTPDSGEVLADGMPVLDRTHLSARVAIIFQDFIRYLMPARANIGIGEYDRFDDLAGIQEAARLSGADRVIDGLPHGYETVLGPEFEEGVEISTGQWQRIALGRAFFRNADIVVLDEPTASLDPEAEQAVFETVRELARDKSVVLISHRFSTVGTADRILVLDSGRVVEQGTHDQLVASGGRYARLFRLEATSFGSTGV
jgi:ATP-binding cassette, subfamily B, bacterial